MSINSIQSYSLEQLQTAISIDRTAHAGSNSTASIYIYDSARSGNTQDSIAISGNATLQNEFVKRVDLPNNQLDIKNAYEAKRSVNFILSFIQTNGFEVLSSLKTPLPNTVYSLTADVVS